MEDEKNLLVPKPKEDLIEKFGFPLLSEAYNLGKKIKFGKLTKTEERRASELLAGHGQELFDTAFNFYEPKEPREDK